MQSERLSIKTPFLCNEEKRHMGGRGLEHRDWKVELLLEEVVCFSFLQVTTLKLCAGGSPRPLRN